ncbi:YdcF family protein [Paenibacillus sp. N1-5-1-14]|uniref:YdcF family protein n=1 Tax=Paenibacillus radicibacter TaxID=2972488 RepID=UPI0021594345|nr:YdcF family protein [Paenibacillus radicibacter]MCR8644457.1 YdcF family protein [Paenibacillus radicibacter]
MTKRPVYFDIGILLVCLGIYLFSGGSFGAMFVCVLGAFILIMWRVDFRKIPIVKKLLVAGGIVFALSFIIVQAIILSAFRVDDHEVHDVDYVVVLGAGLRGTELSQTLWLRMNSALDYLNANKDIPVIVSGGQGPGEDITEAEAMSRYLLQHGIDSSRITLESKATSTEENLLFSKAVLEDKGVKNPRILIVTSDYHMFRAKHLAQEQGYTAYGLTSHGPFFLTMNYMIREYFAMIKMVLYKFI